MHFQNVPNDKTRWRILSESLPALMTDCDRLQSLQVEEVKKFLEDPSAYAAANPVAAAPAAGGGGGEAKKEEKKVSNLVVALIWLSY